MTIRTSIRALAMAMAVAAAGGGQAGADTPKQPDPARKAAPARTYKAAAFSTAPATFTWPTGSRKRELVVSRGWAPDEFYVWYIADGRNVLSVYRTTTRTELDAAIGKFVREATVSGSPTDALSWGIAGAIPKDPPPPPPPEPGGVPEWYLKQVLETSARLDEYVLAPQLLAPATIQLDPRQQVQKGVQPAPAPAPKKP